jgi:hypothetical protein
MISALVWIERLKLSPYNNPAAPERSQVIGEMQRLSASGERERYAASVGGGAVDEKLVVSYQCWF